MVFYFVIVVNGNIESEKSWLSGGVSFVDPGGEDPRHGTSKGRSFPDVRTFHRSATSCALASRLLNSSVQRCHVYPFGVDTIDRPLIQLLLAVAYARVATLMRLFLCTVRFQRADNLNELSVNICIL